MSVASKLSGLTAGLGEALDKKGVRSDPPISQAAPVQLMALRTEMNSYEDKIAALEAKVKDLESTAIPVANISPNPWQPRRVFDEDEIRKLADSIAETGLIQPIIIRRKSVSSGDTLGNPDEKASDAAVKESVSSGDTLYELVAGERRLRAHKLLGLADIKVVIVDIPDADMAMMALVENVDRADLTDFEVSLALKQIENEFPKRKHMAAALGVSRQDLYRYFAFDKMPDFVLADLQTSPGILSRKSAGLIQAVISAHGDNAIAALKLLWTRVKSGDLDQGKIAGLIESAVTKGDKVTTERDIKKLFVSGQQAGSITRDSSNLTVKIRTVALTPEKEVELRAFVEKMFS